MSTEFQSWCLRTYGDSGKTKTVTRPKYNRILQTLQGEETNHGLLQKNGSHINAKFKFWVKSKGFQVGTGSEGPEGPEGPLLYVPVRTTGADGVTGGDLKRVAVVEDFYDIIYSMHVELSPDGGRAPKHAGQKKTYKAIAETFAFLPREAVTRFLMSCTECQKRMHQKEIDSETPPVAEDFDFNVPLTTTYRRLQRHKDESSVSSEEDMSEPTWLSPDLSPRPPHRRRHSKDDDDDSSSESGSGNGVPALTPPPSSVLAAAAAVVSCNGVPLDFSASASSSSSCEDQPPPQAPPPPPSRLPVSVTVAAAALLGALHPPQELRRKYPATTALSQSHASELRLERDARDYGSKSPQYSSGGSYDGVTSGVKMDQSAEDLTCRPHQVTPDDDDDDHDDHDDTDKMNDAEGVDPERLKAFNMFVRLFVDENLDRMVPISKQPKEKIQAIIESCSRQFPEFQERARKRIRTYLKSCRRMKKNGMETRPTPPHLTSAMAENILAAACESESRNAAKRMRLDTYEDLPLEKPSGLSLREPPSLAHSAYSLASSTFSSQENQLYINGAGLSYGYRTFPTVGAMSHPVSLSNGPTDLSMKSLPAALTNHSSLGGRGNSGAAGGGGASTQLSQSEVTAVRQLIAGYRESAAFLLRSADELENLILQQN